MEGWVQLYHTPKMKMIPKMKMPPKMKTTKKVPKKWRQPQKEDYIIKWRQPQKLQDLVFSVKLHLGLIPYPLTIDPCPLFIAVVTWSLILAPGLNIASKVWVLNSKSLVHFILVDFRWWVPSLGMVSDHPCDGGWSMDHPLHFAWY